MLEKENVIQVVLAVYDPNGTYSRHAGVVATSIFSNTHSKVNITILHDATLTDDNKRRFEQTAQCWNQSVSFIDVTEPLLQAFQDPDKEGKRFSRGALYRLLIPRLLNIPKVIYLDCDIVVNMDIKELWETAIDTLSLAAVSSEQNNGPTKSTLHEKLRIWILGCRPEIQFCSGVLLMNLKQIREKHDLPSEARCYFKRYGHIFDFADEDFLFMLFHKDMLLLDKRFDCFDGSGNVDNRIVHLAAAPKPWKYPQKIPEHFLYWDVFMKSEWRDQYVEAVMDAAAEAYKNKTVSYFRSVEFLKCLLWRGLYYLCRIDLLNDWRKDLMIIAKELRYRIFSLPLRRKGR